MVIHFFLIFDRWTTTATPPSGPSVGSVVTGCTVRAFLTLFWDMLHHFGHMGTPAYCGRLYREFGYGCCEVHVDVPAHPFDPGMTAWFTMATGNDLDDTMERAA
jgi:hypothetical protein